MESLRKQALILLVLVSLVATLFQVRPVQAAQQFTLYGAYNEEGLRSGAINCTLYKVGQTTERFTLDGSYLANATAGTVFKFDIGFNESRVYYVYQNESIYVFKPQTYNMIAYVEVVDYIGLQWAYLETLINVNGTLRVVERWNALLQSDLPFTMSFGQEYYVRLVCNKGTYFYKPLVAGETTSYLYAVTSDMFPSPRVDLADLVLNATRMNSTWIRTFYQDGLSNTTWIQTSFFTWDNDTAFLSYNVSSNTVTYDYYDCEPNTDYYVRMIVQHGSLGLKTWSFTCPAPLQNDENPFEILNELGDFIFNPAWIPATVIIIMLFGTFSWNSAPLGIVVVTLMTGMFIYLNWIGITWAWYAIAAPMALLLAFAMWKEREP
jgi:hypothetical protein